MTEKTYLIPLSSGDWLALSPESFMAALAAGSAAVPASGPASSLTESANLLTAEQMAERTAMPASWFLTAARVNEIPHVKLGKYVRFDLAAVTAKLSVK